MRHVAASATSATVFSYHVCDPGRYGVIKFDVDGRSTRIVEKPSEPKSNLAVTEPYFYDNDALEIAASLKPSPREELEITDVNMVYLSRGRFAVELLGRGVAWLDTGTHESLLQAAMFIEAIESRQGLKVCCPEEIAYRSGFLDAAQLERLARPLARTGYCRYLHDLFERGDSGGV